MALPMVSILLVEKNDDDAARVEELLRNAVHGRFAVDRVRAYPEAVSRLSNSVFDACLFSDLAARVNVTRLLNEFTSAGFNGPVILLTRAYAEDMNVRLLEKGLADVLEKKRLDAFMLERSIRYAMVRSRQMSKSDQARKKIQDLSSRLIRAEENQRRAIALELHDSIGSNLAGMKYELDRMARSGRFDPDGMTRVIGAVRETIDDTRRIHTELRPPVLDELGLDMAVRWLCRKFREAQPRIETDLRVELADEHVSEELKIVIFRVLQEALHNVSRHSRAERVSVSLGENDATIELLVEDSGQGFEPQPTCEDEMCEKGTGLDSMRERTEFSGGVFQLQSGSGRGTRIRATWSKNQGGNP